MTSPAAPARILVAFASKSGSTREIAEAIGERLAAAGFEVEVLAAADVRSVARFDAVVLGSGLYSATWLRDANVFIRANRRGLATRPVWLFSSGPLDNSPAFAEPPITPHVAQVLGDLPIREHRTFSGRLLPDAPEVAAGLMAPQKVGDFRDFERVRAWAEEIAAALA